MCTIQVAALPPTGDASLQRFHFSRLKDVGLFFFFREILFIAFGGSVASPATVKPPLPDAKTWTRV